MKRLTLSLLLGVFCLALLAVPTRAGLYDTTKPPPTPYTNSETSWGDTSQVRKIQCPNDNGTTDTRKLRNQDEQHFRTIGFWHNFANSLRDFFSGHKDNQGAHKP
ncbi:MAG: hypothetical protein PHR28_02115 [candidate division Zixibacteria bacterium]|nr:hypothetical protein [candidate division Zixibacteria bacterium]